MRGEGGGGRDKVWNPDWTVLSICQQKWTAIISKSGTMAVWRAEIKARGSTHPFFKFFFVLIYLISLKFSFFSPLKNIHQTSWPFFVAAAALKRAAT